MPGRAYLIAKHYFTFWIASGLWNSFVSVSLWNSQESRGEDSGLSTTELRRSQYLWLSSE